VAGKQWKHPMLGKPRMEDYFVRPAAQHVA